MYTIKFETWDCAYPLHKGTDGEQQAKSTALQEGEKVWHRPFQVANLAELKKWQKEHGWGAVHTTCYIPGKDPHEQLTKIEQYEKHLNARIHFEYMTFFDKNGELWKVIIFCCNAYVMNEAGQTVDSISA